MDVGERYPGNTPRRIGKSAHYTVTADGDVRLRYQLGRKAHTLLTARDHPDLVRQVNDAKRAGGSSGGGAFYINEFRHVLVPVGSGGSVTTLYGGTYSRDLEFDFEGMLITARVGEHVPRGGIWKGPLVGIRYTVTADCRDVYYERESRPGVMERTYLTDFANERRVETMLATFRNVKRGGGRLYVNEAGAMFGPVGDDLRDLRYYYFGQIDMSEWFEDPLG